MAPILKGSHMPTTGGQPGTLHQRPRESPLSQQRTRAPVFCTFPGVLASASSPRKGGDSVGSIQGRTATSRAVPGAETLRGIQRAAVGAFPFALCSSFSTAPSQEGFEYVGW
ncbi:hypothetical protein MC885_012829 [Smutsia gigantea]|nr:hypothetical protein MC885_012829 [Smutsia gigantea]